MGNRKILRGYMRVDKKGNPIVGSTILRAKRPTGMNYVAIEDPATYLCCSPWPAVAGTGKTTYLKFDGEGRLIPGAVTVAKKKPSGNFKQLTNPEPNKVCCTPQ